MGDTLRAKLIYGIDDGLYPELFEHIQTMRDDPDPNASDYDEDVTVPFNLIRSDLQKKYSVELMSINDGNVQIIAAYSVRAVGRSFAFEELGNDVFSESSIVLYRVLLNDFLEEMGIKDPEQYRLQWYLIGENN